MPVARRAALRLRPVQRTHLPLWVWIGLIGIALAALLPVLQSSQATSTGAELRALERARAAQQAQIRQLASQVGELAALARVETVARERLGLTPAHPTTVLSVDDPPPDRLLPARFLPRREPVVETELPWWRQLVDVLIVR
ncbi:MAG: hypothetical protein V3V06_05255 [Dehalococcoidia bacterium]